MKKPDLLTKDEIARELSPDAPLSERSVQRYIALAEVKPAVKGSGRGHVAKFARADVEKIKSAYTAAAEQREVQSTALTTTKPASLSSVALVRDLLDSNQEGFRQLQSALDTWPVWLTRVDALERTGLPASWFDAGVSKKELPHVGEGRGRRFHRDELRAFAERVRGAEYLTELLKR
jgi:hypothetical protein